jgi:hypothetical protein
MNARKLTTGQTALFAVHGDYMSIVKMLFEKPGSADLNMRCYNGCVA